MGSLSKIERSWLNVYEAAFYWCPDEIYRRLKDCGLVDGKFLTSSGRTLTGDQR